MYQAQLVGAPGAGRFDLLKDFFHIHSKNSPLRSQILERNFGRIR